MLQYSTEPREIARIVRPSPQTKRPSMGSIMPGLFDIVSCDVSLRAPDLQSGAEAEHLAEKPLLERQSQ